MNGEYQDDSDIGKLMHDFCCANPDDMKYRLLAEKTRYYKKDEKGVNKMSPVIVEYAQEIIKEERKEIAMNLLEDGIYSISKIADQRMYDTKREYYQKNGHDRRTGR